MPTLMKPRPEPLTPLPKPALEITGANAPRSDPAADSPQMDPPEMSDQLKREIRWCCEWWPPD